MENMNNLTKKPRVVFLACGSFNPPTPMHFRMFEIARDHYLSHDTHDVIGGIISPAHDAYGKKGLIDGTHRYAMVKLGVQNSTWIKASDWEIKQNNWSKTRRVLEFHQNYLNNFINSSEPEEGLRNCPAWVPDTLLYSRDMIKVKLLCGADLLESFSVPGLWADEDIEAILENHGLIVITRSGANPEKFIFDSNVLSRLQKHITLVTNWVPNEISSTMIRRLLQRNQSVKYLMDDNILKYIDKQNLYQNQLNTNVYNTVEKMETTKDEIDESSPCNVKKSLLSLMNKSGYSSKVFCCDQTLPKRSPGKAIQLTIDDECKVAFKRLKEN